MTDTTFESAEVLSVHMRIHATGQGFLIGEAFVMLAGSPRAEKRAIDLPMWTRAMHFATRAAAEGAVARAVFGHSAKMAARAA